MRSASVPEPTPTADSSGPWYAANSRSKACSSGPISTQPESSTRAIAASRSPRIAWMPGARTLKGTRIAAEVMPSASHGGPLEGCGPVVRPMLAVKLDRSSQPLPHVHAWSPLQDAPDLAIVHVDRTDVDRLSLWRKRYELIVTAACDVDEKICQFTQADRLDRPDIEDLAVGGVIHAGQQEGLNHII